MQVCKLIVFFSIILIIFTCHSSTKLAKSELVPLIIEGDMALKLEIEDIIRANPEVVHPETGNKYYMQIVKPDPNIDYHILQVKPAADIDYHMIIINPTTKEQSSRLNSELKDAIIESIKKQYQRSEGDK